MSLIVGWALTIGLFVWIGAMLWSAGVPKGLRSWLKHPKNASKTLRWLTRVLAVAFAGTAWIAWASDPTSELGGFRTEATGIALAVIVIEEISHVRADLDYKQSIIRQMSSRSNDFATDAARIALQEGWLKDGSLEGVTFFTPNLQGAHLSKANLKGVTMIMAVLTNANLSSANLEDANLQFANLEGAHLLTANLKGANLLNARLNRADLFGAYLSGADLHGADFAGADLSMARFLGAKYDDKTVWPDGFTPPADAINVDQA